MRRRLHNGAYEVLHGVIKARGRYGTWIEVSTFLQSILDLLYSHVLFTLDQ
jgi:hypothetical protein